MPPLEGIVETALYVDDLDASEDFYGRLFEFERLAGDDRLRALSVAGRHVLLLFRTGGSVEDRDGEGGVIPAHDARGRIHLAFAVPRGSLPAWRDRLASLEIEIESEMHWSRGGRSLYLRDPDGHLVELATPGIWTIY